ncbi:MAG: efflux RND transporter periplasmic adaptor subunit [Clostridiales bacterium]|nr:efflux RND transporter periplasmic adaptor subunit [Clostridiales bacterium]
MGNDLGVQNRYAGVVEPQDTVEVKIDNGRKVKEVKVKVGDEVKQGQLLFEYDLSSIQEDLQEAKLDLERLKNEAVNLQQQINTLEKEKKQAKADSQLSYTIEIETNKMNLKKNEYDQKSKAAEIQKLENAMLNTEVRSDIDGVIQKIDSSKMSSDESESVENTLVEESSGYTYGMENSENGAFITILSTGAYRVKGMVNELNRQNIIPGEPVIIRSRADENQTWKGTMGNVDQENASSDSNNMYGMMSTSGDSQTNSSSYPFYVQLETSEGLMLGQHVYIEPDQGQNDKKEGLWLSDFFIADADTAEPYVWVADEKKHLEKRSVTLGKYDEALLEYEIVDGLTEDDCIAFPAEGLEEGMDAVVGSGEQTMNAMMSEDMGEPDMESMEGEGSSDEMDPEEEMGEMVPYEEGTEEVSSEFDESQTDASGAVVDDLVPVG